MLYVLFICLCIYVVYVIYILYIYVIYMFYILYACVHIYTYMLKKSVSLVFSVIIYHAQTCGTLSAAPRALEEVSQPHSSSTVQPVMRNSWMSVELSPLIDDNERWCCGRNLNISTINQNIGHIRHCF